MLRTLRLEPRPHAPLWLHLVATLVAVVLMVVGGLLLFAALGYPALASLIAYFVDPLSTVRGLTELAVKSAPLILCGAGLAVGFRANVWNIGAEGQLLMGALAGGCVALAFYGVDSPFLLPAMVVAGALGGMAWGAIPALLRAHFNVNEILSSLMLTYVATHLLDYLIRGPLRDPDGFGFPESRLFHDSALLPMLLEGTRLHAGVLFAVVAALVAWLILSRSLLGFQIKVVGQAPEAASYAGFSPKRTVWFAFLFSGGLAGIAGLCEIAGPIGQITPSISPGYGFAAIIVAFLGRLHPLGVVVAGLVLGLTYLGGESVRVAVGMPQAVTGVFQGMLLFFVLAADVLVRYRLRWERIVAGPAPGSSP